MPDDPSGSGDAPTLTPSQAVGISATSATVADTRPTPAKGALPERYQLGKQLGAGGMGEVLLASDRQIERDVAIKRMRMEPTPGAVARFIREAKIQGRLDHPAIVPVHELATDAEGRPFFVMKRLSGTTLAEVIGGRTHSRQKLLRAFADVCFAIEFAHSRHIIHRDLKPANIMLGDFGEVYVLDWGVARALDETDKREGERAGTADAGSRDGATEVGAILGTPGYISPELLRGERLDTRADVYALGCILFEILAGEPLLPRGREALDAALRTIDARPSVRAPDVPPELDAICVAATATNRAERPTARELADRIERFLDGDRDLALRKTLATSHVATGRAALENGDDETARSTAMREAGRAIALDPRNQEAAALIGRLMLEPPKEIPRAVDERVAELEEKASRDKVRMMIWVLGSFLLFIPTTIFMGMRERGYKTFAVLLVAIAFNVIATVLTARQKRRLDVRNIVISWLVFCVMIVVISRLFTPFLIAPGLAATSVMMFAMDPRTPWRACAVCHIVAVLAPWLLEVTDVLSATTRAIGGNLVLSSPTVSTSMPEAGIALAIYAICLILVASFLAHKLALTHRNAVRAIELQAWHLRQLVNN